MRVAFFGTPPFAAQILEGFVQQGIEIVAVVTQPPRPKGRSGVPVWGAVGQYAQTQGFPLLAPIRAADPEFLDHLASYHADVFVVVAYGQILKPQLLAMPPLGCFNAHASLLPLYRGAAPIHRALMDGVEETGVTIIAMNAQMDAGDMVRVASLPVAPNATFGEVEAALCSLGQKELLALLADLEAGCPLTFTPQDHTHATLAPKIRPEETQIRWDRSAHEVHNHIRALSPKPGAWCFVEIRGILKRLKVFAARVADQGAGALLAACGEGAIELLTVQLEGKRAISGEELLRGASPARIL